MQSMLDPHRYNLTHEIEKSHKDLGAEKFDMPENISSAAYIR